MRLLVLLCVIGCSAKPVDRPPAQRAFYFWRTSLALSPTETQALAAVHATKLYVKLFDLDPSGQVVGELAKASVAPAGVELVPVVFIRQQVFAHPPPALAKTTWTRVAAILARLGTTAHELQIDCDWTATSRDAFFAFLTDLRASVPTTIALSATIRLHQIKFRERTGVPPVARGMLMFYNMGKFSAEAGDRAIYDETIAKEYVARLREYPLPLDVALPIWSWTLHLRDGEMQHLLQATTAADLAQQDFLVALGPDRFRVTRTTYLDGELVREGDELKVEAIAPADTLGAAKLVAKYLAPGSGPRTISLFDLSDRNLTRHDTTSLDQAFSALR